MGNLLIGFKKFLQNKNIVTIVGIVLIILILYFSYTRRVRSAINPVVVPYATKQISSATQITKDMIGTREVPPSMLEGKVLLTVGEVIDRYVAIDTVIPEGSLFYKSSVVEREQLPDAVILDVREGEQLYYLRVDSNKTFGNKIYPGNYIKLSFSANASDGMLQSADLFSHVKVLAVKDASGVDVFRNIDEARTPAMIIFALKEEYFKTLLVAETMYSNSISITTDDYVSENAVVEVNTETKNWIDARALYVE